MGCSGLIFYHFESKDTLLSAAFACAAERDLERLDAAATGGEAPRAASRESSRCTGRKASAPAERCGSTPGQQPCGPGGEVSRRLDVRWKDTVAESSGKVSRQVR
jgi:AcrR family transcriptional regulator